MASPASYFPKACIGLILAALCSACQPAAPRDKDAYIMGFSALAYESVVRCGQHSPQELKALDRQYIRYSRHWQERFYPQMSAWEKSRVWAYRAQYLSCRLSREAHQAGKSLFRRLEDELTGKK